MTDTTEPLKPGTIQFVIDGPPAHESGRFVELEDHTGASIGMGRWEDRGNGLWALIVEPAGTATLEAVMDLHRPAPPYLLDVPEVCEHCSDNEDEREVAYPCPTVRVITREDPS